MVIKMVFMNIINLFLSITLYKKNEGNPLNDSVLVNDIETGLFHDTYHIDIKVV
jgi:hypothetical protein